MVTVGGSDGELCVDVDLIMAAQEAIRIDESATIATPAGKVFVQVFAPPPRLVVVGAVHIADTLARMAALSGYGVTIVDPRRAFAASQDFGAVAVTGDWPDEDTGRAVAMRNSGACRPRSASACKRSSEVGSAQCRSSTASAPACERAPARTKATIAANCRRRNSSGGRLGARPAGSGTSTIGASKGACSAGSRPASMNGTEPPPPQHVGERARPFRRHAHRHE